jgi:hypothetical protein
MKRSQFTYLFIGNCNPTGIKHPCPKNEEVLLNKLV